jgi:hypothetical protein
MMEDVDEEGKFWIWVYDIHVAVATDKFW